MKLTSATYQHTVIGWPKAILKWHYNGTSHTDPYLTIDGVIKPWAWSYREKAVGDYQIKREMARFDDYVLAVYGNNADLQG